MSSRRVPTDSGLPDLGLTGGFLWSCPQHHRRLNMRARLATGWGRTRDILKLFKEALDRCNKSGQPAQRLELVSAMRFLRRRERLGPSCRAGAARRDLADRPGTRTRGTDGESVDFHISIEPFANIPVVLLRLTPSIISQLSSSFRPRGPHPLNAFTSGQRAQPTPSPPSASAGRRTRNISQQTISRLARSHHARIPKTAAEHSGVGVLAGSPGVTMGR